MQMYYGSVIRYKDTWGRQPEVIFKEKNEDLVDLLNSMVKTWTNKWSPRVNATEALQELFSA
jgi:hypothetical protein